MDRPLVIVGFMGAGKSTLGRRLAEHRRVEHVDTDTLLEQHFGRPISEVFATGGEAVFRDAEREVVTRVLAEPGERIVSLGGGAAVDATIAAALKDHAVVLLDVPVATAWERARESDRPLARDRTAFGARYDERQARYEALGAAVIRPDHPDVLVDADAALRTFATARSGTRMTWGRSESGQYPVFVGPGVLGLRPPGLDGRPIIVTDELVGPLHAGSVAGAAGMVEIPSGEEHKTLATAERVWQALAAQSVTRTDHLVALGGGVVGDLAGFAAACYQRGIKVVQAPTTIVSQVDSAYGGKTGVDLPQAKNYVGIYHQPACVLADTTTLATLPAAEHAAGYAEVLKTALISGGRLWDRIAAGHEVDEEIIFACARTKLDVVADDERDSGRRQVLNLGHTVGHALETVLGYGTLRHGEAVGLGLLAALRLSGRDNLRAVVAELLAAHGLPTTLSGRTIDPDELLAAIARDKKRVGAAPTPFVLVKAPGAVEHGREVPLQEIAAAVKELLG